MIQGLVLPIVSPTLFTADAIISDDPASITTPVLHTTTTTTTDAIPTSTVEIVATPRCCTCQ